MSKEKKELVVAKRALVSGTRTGRGGRLSAPRKAQVVLHLLQGEDLELLSRELGLVASTLSLWREQFLAPGQLTLTGRTGKADIRDEQISRLKKKVGELPMDNKLLQEKAHRLEAGLPLAHRRSRRGARPARSPRLESMACNGDVVYGMFPAQWSTSSVEGIQIPP